MQSSQFIIIGAGVIGLSTAVYLRQKGIPVNIITKELAQHSTSAKAAAIWLPFKVEPQDKVNKWSRLSFDYFVELSKIEQSGVSMIDFIVLATDDRTPSWYDALPQYAVRMANPNELPKGYDFVHVAHVPLIESPLYLDYLTQTFMSMDGVIEQKSIHDFDEVQTSNQTLINCSGMGSKKLCQDNLLYPIQGHLVRAKVKENIKCIADDDGPNALSYVIPRKDAIILGGTAIAHADDEKVNPQTVAQIRKRCEQIEPNIKDLQMIDAFVGLRPARSSIRLLLVLLSERSSSAQNVLHCGGCFCWWEPCSYWGT